jgi:hypothetical protein
MPLDKREECTKNFVVDSHEGTYCFFDVSREHDSPYPVSSQELSDFEKSLFSQS